jgi:hypothetical protein
VVPSYARLGTVQTELAQAVADALKGHPDIHIGAVSGLCGFGDFMAAYEYPPEKWDVFVATVAEQQRILRIQGPQQ